MPDDHLKPIRVLAIDGGGTRGIYSAEYLRILVASAAGSAGVDPSALDPGKAFDLIAGTSTGGIIACALALGRPLDRIVQLYRKNACKIFPERVPTGLRPYGQFFRFLYGRSKVNMKGRLALEESLNGEFGQETFGSLWESRQIAVCLPAVNLERGAAWIFKTPHLNGTRGRENNCRLVDACMATTAAPIYRSLAALPSSDNPDVCNVFVDGGLWANNPTLVAMVDALRLRGSADRPIHIYSLGTCAQKEGNCLASDQADQGPIFWRFGGKAATLSMDAQADAYNFIAGCLSGYLPNCSVYRFPSEPPPSALFQYLSLDEASSEGLDALVRQAHRDADLAHSKIGNANDPDGRILARFLDAIKETRMARSTEAGG